MLWHKEPACLLIFFLVTIGLQSGRNAICGEDLTAGEKSNGNLTAEVVDSESKFKITPIPLILPISDPLLGYGYAGGAMALIRKNHQNAYLGPDGMIPPDLFILGGFKRSNESKGILGRYKGHWLGDRLQTDTIVGGGTLNLSFFGSDGGIVAIENRGGLT